MKPSSGTRRVVLVFIAVGALSGCLDLDEASYRFGSSQSGPDDRDESRSDGGRGTRADGGNSSTGGDGGTRGKDAGTAPFDAGTPQPVGGCLVVTPNSVDLGTVKSECSSAAKTFTVYNTCSEDRSVKLTAVKVQTGTDEFLLTDTPTIPPGGLTLSGAGASVTFQLKYHPFDEGFDEAELVVTAQEDEAMLGYPVHVRATGDEKGEQIDVFVQPEKAKADVLLVVDDSCSMEDKQANLAANFDAFMAYAVSANVDYQIGVTSTTIRSDSDGGSFCIPNLGCLPGTDGDLSKAPDGLLYRDLDAGIAPILTAATPRPKETFAKMVKLETAGGGIEAPLAAATLALSEPKRSHENAGFIRDDANLAVVVVSDASDQSEQDVSYYLNLLLNVKGANQRSHFTFNAIVPTLGSAPPNCTYDTDANGEDRYTPLVNATSGVMAEICSTDWAAPLTHLGELAFGFRTQFFLTAVPDLGNGNTLEVRINGVKVGVRTSCPTDTNSIVCFDAETNSVRVDVDAAPAGGDTITVKYATGCH